MCKNEELRTVQVLLFDVVRPCLLFEERWRNFKICLAFFVGIGGVTSFLEFLLHASTYIATRSAFAKASEIPRAKLAYGTARLTDLVWSRCGCSSGTQGTIVFRDTHTHAPM